jgi:Ca2+-binding RTX toxin-like protein
MAILTVGPNSDYPSIAAAMVDAKSGDELLLEAGYSNETATITVDAITVSGAASSLEIELHLAIGVATFTLAGEAPINVLDSATGNAITGNDGNNEITVTAGADAVNGGAGINRLIVD